MEAGAFKKRVLVSPSIKSLRSLFSVLYTSSFLSRVVFRHIFFLLVLARYLVIFFKGRERAVKSLKQS